ncbi:hypothetical protein [Maricaulis sp.]|uniref:hypothetical protein n=1 Tax=Maricaulis sp. TaxID=1486257 RepID=UPI003A91DFD2
MFTRSLLAAVALATGMVMVPAMAQRPATLTQGELPRDVTPQFIGSRLSFNADSSLSNFTLRVSGPQGYTGEVTSARVAPTFRLADFGSVPDGLYTYELAAATTQQLVRATPEIDGANGRSGGARPGLVGTTTTGTFRVLNGQILQQDSAATER